MYQPPNAALESRQPVETRLVTIQPTYRLLNKKTVHTVRMVFMSGVILTANSVYCPKQL